MVEKQIKRHVQTLHTNNSLEIYNGRFNSYYTKEEIIHHHIVPHTPQQNEVIEKMNYTILEKVLCMFLKVKLLKSF